VNQRQVVAHYINRQGRKDEDYRHPEAPVPMRMLPVRTARVIFAVMMMPAVSKSTHGFPLPESDSSNAYVIIPIVTGACPRLLPAQRESGTSRQHQVPVHLASREVHHP
jgi:hypothetical protein